jgi:hypothetical protein
MSPILRAGDARVFDASQIPDCHRIGCPSSRSTNVFESNTAGDFPTKIGGLPMNDRVIKRLFSLDSLTDAEGGALSVKSKELMGLVASLAPRCDDCGSYGTSD